jgi:uncharacterized peroxidase-related enzyme
MSRIKVIQEEEAQGRLKEIYDELTQSRGKLAEVHKIQSLRPESIVKHMELYMEIMFSKSELSRARREMIAVVVSTANGCRYCQGHHGSALNHYWKDDNKVSQLKKDPTQLNLSKEDLVLCEYANNLTRQPAKAEATDVTQPLKAVGFSDAAILDATLVAGYFNFVNRVVLGLGVSLETDEGKGYEY